MQKIILMGCLKHQDETLKNFHSQPKKWPILKILAPNPKKMLRLLFDILFLVNFTTYNQLLVSFRTFLMKYS